MALRDLSRAQTQVEYRAGAADAGRRLDAFLQEHVFWRSRTDLQRRIREARVLVDGKPARKNSRLQPGQVVTVFVDEVAAAAEVPVASIPIEILFEDEHLVALDKAAGTVVHPVGRHVLDTVINALHVRYREAGRDVVPMIVHRLDRETSGVLVLAKNPEARKRLGAHFETRRVAKSYLAVVAGVVRDDRGAIDLPIGSDPHSEIRLKMACVPEGRPSLTEFEVLARGRGWSLVRCRPRTGRQHQIRVHLAAIGHPILADALYGTAGPMRGGDLDPDAPEPERILLARHALHAESLEFDHPATGARMRLEAPPPPDFAPFAQ
jgi:23S rRNA pseudouridine1911/1915/1917 synthase